MTIPFIIACIVAGTFFFLWQEEKEKLAAAEKQIRQLKKRKSPQKKRTEPVTVEKSRQKREYVIRKPEPQQTGPFLDQRKLAELKEQTSTAQSMLAEIFVDKDEPAVEIEVRENNDYVREVLEKLFAKDVWTRGEIAELAGPDVMVGSLLEQINDYSCSRIDDIVVEEDGDNIYVTTEYKEHLI